MTLKTSILITAESASARAEVERMKGSITELRGAAAPLGAALRNAFGAIAAAAGVREIARMADGYGQLVARLKLATAGQDEFKGALAGIQAIATRSLAPLAETAQLYTRLAGAVKSMGGSQQEALQITEAMAAALRLGGATTAEASSAMLQFSQAMGSGVLRGEEFNSMLDSAPVLLKAVADGMGVAVGQLRGLAEQGKLTSDVVGNALIKGFAKLQADAATMPQTISGSFTLLGNAATVYVGKADAANGASVRLGNAIKAVADNFKQVGDAAVTAAGVAVAAIGGRMVAATVSATAALGTAGLAGGLSGILSALGGPVGIVAALALAGAAWVAFGERGKSALDEIGKAADDTAAKLKKLNAEGKFGTGDLGTERAKLERIQGQISVASESRGPGAAKLLADLREKERQSEELIARLEGSAAASASGTLKPIAPTIDEAAKGLKTRTRILKDAADDLKKIDAAYAAEIAKAQGAGNSARVIELQRAQREDIQARKKERDNALDSLSEGARQPKLKEEFDREYALTKDAIAGQLALAEEGRRDSLGAVREYYAQKALLGEEDFDNEKRKLLRERSELENHLRLLKAREKGAKKDQKEPFAEAIGQDQEKLRKLEADLTLLERGRARDAGKDSRQQVRDELAALESQFNETMVRMATKEQSLNIQRQSGVITETQARAEILRLYRETATEVEGLIPEMERLNQALPSEASSNRLAQIRNRVAELKVTTNETAVAINGALGDGLKTLFKDVASGSKTAKEAMLDFLNSIGNKMLDILSNRFAENLLGDLGKTGGSGSSGGFGGWLTKLLGFHSGGVVGASGGSFSRSVPLSAILTAPRYHSGGLIGGNEQVIIAEKGEEVLTANDPRHVRNGRGGVQTVKAEIINNGTPQKITGAEMQFDLKGAVLRIMTEDLAGNGSFSRASERTYGLNRAAGASV